MLKALLKGREMALEEIDSVCTKPITEQPSDQIVFFSKAASIRLKNELKLFDNFKASSLAKAGKKALN